MNNQEFLNIAKAVGTVEATDAFLDAWEESLKEDEKVENNEATIFLKAYTFAFENNFFQKNETFETFKNQSFRGSPVRVSRKLRIQLWAEYQEEKAHRENSLIMAGYATIKGTKNMILNNKYENMILDFQDSEFC